MKLLSTIKKLVFSNVLICAIGMIIQVAYLAALFWTLGTIFSYSYIVFALLGLSLSIYIINTSNCPEYKMIWIFTILSFPLFGSMLYIFFGFERGGKKKDNITDKAYSNEIHQEYHITRQAHYITKYCDTDIFMGNEISYYKNGELLFPALLDELNKAESFIFLEFFIIEDGVMWNSILSILKAKVKKGVDVRVIYDDMGCLLTLPRDYRNELDRYGIKCCVFGRLKPFWTRNMNNRDHRKILIIDDITALTGGINLADEYINAYDKHGYWKDSAVIIKGSSVSKFTQEFLFIWNKLSSEKSYYDHLNKMKSKVVANKSIVIPFFDSPDDKEPLSRNIYINMINSAKRYVYITTPYLIPDSETINAITMAAKNGIDIKIITPHIPDKAIVQAVTRSYYRELINNGVKIYEFLPGFIHQKNIISDDKVGIVGTVNLDFRSLYLHHECGLWIYNDISIEHIRQDYIETLKRCECVELNKTYEKNPVKRLFYAVFKFFAPLM